MIFHVDGCSSEFYCVILQFQILIVSLVDLVFRTRQDNELLSPSPCTIWLYLISFAFTTPIHCLL